MVNISKKKLKPHVEKTILNEFMRQLAHAKQDSQVKEFLYDFLTPSERLQLAKRLAIVLLLLRGNSFAQIEKTLKVSPPTVGKQWRNLKDGKYTAIRKIDFWHGHSIPENSTLESLFKLVTEGLPPRASKRRWDFLREG